MLISIFYYGILSFFYLATATIVFLTGLGLGVYTFEEINRPQTDIFLVIVGLIALGVHHLSKEWIPNDYYHLTMMIGIIMPMLPIMAIGNVFGFHA